MSIYKNSIRSLPNQYIELYDWWEINEISVLYISSIIIVGATNCLSHTQRVGQSVQRSNECMQRFEVNANVRICVCICIFLEECPINTHNFATNCQKKVQF